MAVSPPTLSATARRLRWALLVALALHGVLLWRYAPQVFARIEAVGRAVVDVTKSEEPDIVEITPPEPPPKSRGMTLSTRLGAGGNEPIPAELPPGFFDKPAGMASGRMQISGDLDFARASGIQIVANIVPAAVRLPGIKSLSERARTPRARPAESAAVTPEPAAPLQAAQSPTEEAAERAEAEALAAEMAALAAAQAAAEAVPLLLPPTEDYDVDAAIARAAQAAAASASTARPASNPAPDYRTLLPQGPVVPAAPLPFGGNRRAPSDVGEGITTYALDAPAASDNRRAAPDQGRATAPARQQFFAQLTARLKAANVRLLAEAVKAGPKVTVRMKFLIDRSGRVLEVSAAEPASAKLVERAAAVIRAAVLPPVPDAMADGPLELSFPIEVYR